MAFILNGIEARNHMQSELQAQIAKHDKKPVLVIMQVGSRADSDAYINQKKLFGEKIGAIVMHRQYPEDIAQEVLIKDIEKYNTDMTVHGILLQIPLPAHLNKEEIINKIDPAKDVDGLTAYNAKLLADGKNAGLIPATARGVLALLDYYKIPVSGKKVTVVGRSALVGKPTALALINRNATVSVGHKSTQDLKAITKLADILVVAIGDPEFIDKEYLSPGQTVIDIGINVKDPEKNKNTEASTNMKPENELPKRKIVGDVNFKDAESIVAAISPVPGGVGPMTVASLFQNLLEAYKNIEKN